MLKSYRSNSDYHVLIVLTQWWRIEWLSPFSVGKVNDSFAVPMLKPLNQYLSHLVEKPIMWFANRSDTNRSV